MVPVRGPEPPLGPAECCGDHRRGVPATERRKKSRLGVSADALEMCGLRLGSPREVWVEQPTGGSEWGRTRGLWLGERRKELRGGPGSETGTSAYQCYGQGPAPASLWPSSWGYIREPILG